MTEPIRDLHFNPGEGYLYQVGQSILLVYTGASKDGWSACESSLSGEFTTNVLTGATSRREAVSEVERRYG